MRSATLPTVIIALGVCLPVAGQQANQNINVLPIFFNEQNDPSLPLDPEAELKGDLFLQRQVEPTIAASTRNPDHLISFFVDYRAVDIPDDRGLGESQVARKEGPIRTFLARLFGKSKKKTPPELPPQAAAAAEAWVGGSRSYDGGLTWSGFFLPGGPFDNSPASLSSPLFGLEAATDPIAAAAPCGLVYVAAIGFTREDQSKMVVAKYEDLNNDEGGDTWIYHGTTVVEVGNNAANGPFIDKPFLTVDARRPADPADPCAHNVYVSYSTFNGTESDGKFRSKVTFAKSSDGGQNFTVQKLNAPFHQNQGTWIAVDPRPGTPKTTGGGTIYLVWRHFFNPDTILMVDSTNFGDTFPGNPREILGHLPMATFDQPTGPTTAVFNPVTDVAFRSNGFPTAAVTSDGTLFACWQERVEIETTSSIFGQPVDAGSPRIVCMRSLDGGSHWSGFDPFGGNAERQAVDFGDRDVANPPPTGFGALPQVRPSGPQVMPILRFGGGRLMLTYYESRGFLGIDSEGREVIQTSADVTPSTGFITGIDRVMDLRAALLDPGTGALLSTTQVSRYTLKAGADLSDGETLEDVIPVNSPCFPDDPAATVLCARSVNTPNKPTSGAGSSPFMGDYNFLSPIVDFIPDPGQGGWKRAIHADDVPYQSFHAVWADNRNLIPPTEPPNLPEWARYQSYGPPGIGGACVNPGAKNSDILTARVDAELIITAPTTYKQLDVPRSFPMSVMNGSDSERFYRLTIVANAASASFLPEVDLDQHDVPIFPFSTISQVIYVEAGTVGSIKVTVEEVDGIGGGLVPGGQTGSITFNSDGSNPQVAGLGDLEIQDPFALNPFALNPFALNPFALNSSPSNPFALNPFALNPFALNPFALNAPIIDTTWTVSGGDSNTAGSYLPVINVDNASEFLQNYAFQLLIYRTSSSGGVDACDSFQIPQDQILSNLVLDPDIDNPFALNPFALNTQTENPFALNPFALNSTFTVEPDDSGPGGSQLSRQFEARAAVISNDGTLKAPRATDRVRITLRAVQLVPDDQLGDFVFDPAQDPPSLTIIPLGCDPTAPRPGCNVISTAPDLAAISVSAPASAVEAGGPVAFPPGGWTLRNQGTTDATAENRDLRHGIYLSADDMVDLSPTGGPTNGDVLLATFLSSTNTLEPGMEESFAEALPVIPIDTVAGDYFIMLFVDDLMEVSENDEVNNIFVFPITVEDPNTSPIAVDASFGTSEDTPLTDFLPIGDAEGDLLSFILISGVTNGSLSIDEASRTFTYVPDADFSGSDSFSFKVNDGELDSDVATITLTVSAANDAPVADSQTATTEEDSDLTLTLAGSDIDGDALTFSIVTTPANGTLSSVTPDGTVTYVPNADFNGSDGFQFQVDDGNGGTSVASVEINVTAVNDAPVVTDSSFTTDEDSVVSGTITSVDVDGDGLTFALVTDGALGTATVDGATGAFAYTPDLDATGTDSFTVAANDGTVSSNVATITVTLQPINDAPTADAQGAGTDEDQALVLTLTGSDVDGDALTFSIATPPTNGVLGTIAPEGTVTYTPNVDFNGSDSFQFQVDDGNGGSATASVSITVQPVNDPSVVSDAAITTAEDTPVVGALSATDVDGDGLTFALVTDGALGTATVNSATGTFTYTPAPDANGADSFTVKANDGAVDSNVATISVTVQPVNDAPVAVPDVANMEENGGPITIDVLLNDFDIDGGELFVTGVGDPTNGTAAITAGAKAIVYTPDVNFVGTETFFYQLDDSLGGVSTGTATVTVVDAVADLLFLGLQSPWKVPPPITTSRVGSAFPVVWQYADPTTGAVVESSGTMPEVRIKGPFSCSASETTSTVEMVAFPGNSGFQYNDSTDTHQFNWDTNNLGLGCYNIRVFSETTRQLDGPFVVRLR